MRQVRPESEAFDPNGQPVPGEESTRRPRPRRQVMAAAPSVKAEPDAPHLEGFLTTRDLAERVAEAGVDYQTVLRAVAGNPERSHGPTLLAHKFGRHWYIALAEAEAYIALHYPGGQGVNRGDATPCNGKSVVSVPGP